MISTFKRGTVFGETTRMLVLKCKHTKVTKYERNNSYSTKQLACLHDQDKSGFSGGPAYIQPIRAIWKALKKFRWLEKSRPSKKATLFWSCKHRL